MPNSSPSKSNSNYKVRIQGIRKGGLFYVVACSPQNLKWISSRKYLENILSICTPSFSEEELRPHAVKVITLKLIY